jgi:hypothetical protein
MSDAGRAPNTKRLNLAAAGVELDKVGAVKVNHSFLIYYAFCSIFDSCLAAKVQICGRGANSVTHAQYVILTAQGMVNGMPYIPF